MSKHPFVLLLVLIGVTLVGGIAYMLVTARPTDEATFRAYADRVLEENGVNEPVETEEPAATASFTYLIEDIGPDRTLSLKLPGSWSDASHLVDFGGFGEGEGDVAEVSGKVITIVRDGKPYVFITSIYIDLADDPAIPDSAELILKTGNNAYFAQFPTEQDFENWSQTMTNDDRVLIEEAKEFVKTLKEMPTAF